MVFQEQPPDIMFVLLCVSPASVSLSLPLCPKRASTGDTAWKLETGNITVEAQYSARKSEAA